jgi:transposase
MTEGPRVVLDTNVLISHLPGRNSICGFRRKWATDSEFMSATDLNTRPIRKLGVSRSQLFEELDRPALGPLPVEPYVYAEWRIRRVSLDYHVDIDGHYYSVPHRLQREQVESRITARTVEVFHKGERVAVHQRGTMRGRHTTMAEHMPQSHRRHAEWTIERIRQEAAAIGDSTAALTALILESRPHPEQGFRACLGILRLARPYGGDRLEAAYLRGLEIGARSYGSVQSILRHGLDRQSNATPGRSAVRPGELPLIHPNIRGSDYYS